MSNKDQVKENHQDFDYSIMGLTPKDEQELKLFINIAVQRGMKVEIRPKSKNLKIQFTTGRIGFVPIYECLD
ncbi:MAG TPA: hypothetical protein VKP03_00695 [Patescibacteria group bacterium]|nr:hypothetical protein [Patescibacteria group bacterium]